MGLSVSLNNALSGLKIGQSAMQVLSQNVANAGTPGYHARSISVIDTKGINSNYAREGQLTRAFNESLQQHYTSANSDFSYANIRSDFLDTLQNLFGMPGSAGSLDSTFNGFQSAMTSLAATPDNFATRAQAVQSAQLMAESLNRTSDDIQNLRQDVENKIATSVDDLNSTLSSLGQINDRLADQGMDDASRATLLDQRDRLIKDLSAQVDVRVTYRSDDTVALMTRSGVGLLDNGASVFSYQSSGAIGASSQYDADDAKSGVGKLMLTTPSGFTVDIVGQNVLRSGEIAGLIDLRDNTLVRAQNQLDDIAASLSQAFSTDTVSGTAASNGANSGFDVDLSPIRDGNEVDLTYTVNGIQKSVRVVRVDDTSKLPLDYQDSNGARVIGVSFAGGAAAVANKLQDALGGGLVVSSPGGNTLRILDDGNSGTTDVASLQTKSTVSGLQSGSLAVNLFVDGNGSDFTDTLAGFGQRRGYASRIMVNPAIVNDSTSLVQYQPGGSLGDATRVNQLIDNLDNMRFSGGAGNTGRGGGYILAGSVSDFINQTINYQGNAAASAQGDSQTQQLTLNALGDRLDGEYGVDIDEEMSRLLELQNSYAANARVMSAVQDLINSLLNNT